MVRSSRASAGYAVSGLAESLPPPTEPRASDPSVAIASALPELVQRLAGAIAEAGFRVRRCTRLNQVLECLHEVDLVLLGQELPPRGGLAACVEIRAASPVPLLVMGRHMSERERVVFLDRGADDVLAWPMGELEALARVRAHLRRRAMQPLSRTLPLAPGRVLDLENGLVLVDGRALPLTPTEARVMRALAARQGRPYPVRELVETVWGRSYPSSGDTDILRANIYRLRRKLEADPRRPQLLRFFPGQGWVLGQPAVVQAVPRAAAAPRRAASPS